MFSFLKRKISAKEFADSLFERIKGEFATGYEGRCYPKGDHALSIEIVKHEWLYFDVFETDLCVFASFAKRDTPTKNAILDRFWSRIREWLTTIHVPALPERGAFDMSGWELLSEDGVISIRAEGPETAYERMRRRCATYSEAIRTPHPRGENYGIAEVFCTLCGEGLVNGLDLLEVSTYFSLRKVGFAEALKPLRVTAPREQA